MSRHQWGLCRAREGDAPFTTPISAAAAPSEHLSATSVPGTLGTELEASSEEMIVEAEEGGEAQATDRATLLDSRYISYCESVNRVRDVPVACT
jgi:hypothetical protein